jgi:hypothetical protein
MAALDISSQRSNPYLSTLQDFRKCLTSLLDFPQPRRAVQLVSMSNSLSGLSYLDFLRWCRSHLRRGRAHWRMGYVTKASHNPLIFPGTCIVHMSNLLLRTLFSTMPNAFTLQLFGSLSMLVLSDEERESFKLGKG